MDLPVKRSRHKAHLVVRSALLLAALGVTAPAAGEEPDLFSFPAEVRRIVHYSAADHSMQPALFYAPRTKKARPLLVALHSWSHGYDTKLSIPYASWCVQNRWVFIHPHFRGPNRRPQATGSELSVQDILSAVEHARKHAKVDTSRIYVAGYSSGGLSALLVAARAPSIWAGVSAWGAVTDLQEWYGQLKALGLDRYARDIERSVGGEPVPGSTAAAECRQRSPLTYLEQARAIPIDLNAGIDDGHGHEVVPISHSLNAFNVLAQPADRLAPADIDFFARRAEVPEHLRQAAYVDPAYGDRLVLFRRQSGNVRLTIFSGGHTMLQTAAMKWLSRQRKPAAP